MMGKMLTRDCRIGYREHRVSGRALPPESRSQNQGGGWLARCFQGLRLRLDVGAFGVGLCGAANLGISFRQHIKRSASAEDTVAGRQPLTDAVGCDGFPQHQNDLAQVAQPLVILGPNCRGLLPVANGSHRGSRSFRDRRLSQSAFAKPPDNLSRLNGPAQILRNVCSGSH